MAVCLRGHVYSRQRPLSVRSSRWPLLTTIFPFPIGVVFRHPIAIRLPPLHRMFTRGPTLHQVTPRPIRVLPVQRLLVRPLATKSLDNIP